MLIPHLRNWKSIYYPTVLAHFETAKDVKTCSTKTCLIFFLLQHFLLLLTPSPTLHRIKSDFFYRLGDKRHKTQKSNFEIFFPEIAHGMPIHLVYFFLFESFIFFEKKNQNRHYPSLLKMGRNSKATWVYKNA